MKINVRFVFKDLTVEISTFLMHFTRHGVTRKTVSTFYVFSPDE